MGGAVPVGGRYVLSDTHAHLEDPRFDPDRGDVLRRARLAGVQVFICVGSDLPTSRQAVRLAGEEQDCYAAVGVHPHEAAGMTPHLWEELQLLAGEARVVAWGEIGLDFHYNFSPPETQAEVFRKQLELAGAGGLPVIVHDREAHRETLAVLKDFPGLPGVVLHCFSGDRRMAGECLARGYHLGVGGTLTHPRSRELREIMAEVPLERLLLETDCPYLAPQPWRGKRNEPAYLTAVVEALADLRGLPPEQVAATLTENARRFFRLP